MTTHVLDRSDSSRIFLTGEDRKSFLQAIVSNDVTPLVEGRGVEALLLTPKGKLVAPLTIFDLSGGFLVEYPGELREAIVRKLTLYVLRQQVEVADVTNATAALGVYGPEAEELLAGLGGEMPGSGRLDCRETEIAGAEVVLARVVRLGRPGFDVHLVAEDREPVAAAIERAGAERLMPETAEAFRIAAGEPRWGREMDENLLPPEIPELVPRAISYTKGCYIGQETIARIKTYGHVNRELRRLAVEGEGVPETGTELLAGDQRAGTITSSARHPESGEPVALGFVKRPHFDPGTELAVTVGGETVTVKVLPPE